MFSVSVSNVDESQRTGEAPADYVLRLAEAKARAAIPNAQPEHIIIGADTTVVDGNRIFGKPKDMMEATAMLKLLRGHAHRVYTALAVLRIYDEQLITDLCVTDVPMRNYTDEEIEAYVLSGDPLDKAGAMRSTSGHRWKIERCTLRDGMPCVIWLEGWMRRKSWSLRDPTSRISSGGKHERLLRFRNGIAAVSSYPRLAKNGCPFRRRYTCSMSISIAISMSCFGCHSARRTGWMKR